MYIILLVYALSKWNLFAGTPLVVKRESREPSGAGEPSQRAPAASFIQSKFLQVHGKIYKLTNLVTKFKDFQCPIHFKFKNFSVILNRSLTINEWLKLINSHKHKLQFPPQINFNELFYCVGKQLLWMHGTSISRLLF